MNATTTSIDPQDRIPQEIIDAFEEFDMSVYACEHNDGTFDIELAGHTGAGGEQTHMLHLDDIEDVEEWRNKFTHMVYEWDPKEESTVWPDSLDSTPFDNLIDLYDDLRDYQKDVLEGVIAEMNNTPRHFVPEPVAYVLDERSDGALSLGTIEESDDGWGGHEVRLECRTEQDYEFTLTARVFGIADIDAWQMALDSLAGVWDSQKQAELLEGKTDGNIDGVIAELDEFKRNVLDMTVEDLRLLSSLDCLGYLAA